MIGAGLMVLVGVLVWPGDYGWQAYHVWQQQRTIAGFERLKDRYRQDQYGGATPEATLKMFIEAFKAGDLDLASKYFIPEKQAEYLAKMKNWVRLGKGEEIIKNLLYEEKKCYEYKKECELLKYNKTLNAWSTTIFTQNEFTQKWKLKNM